MNCICTHAKENHGIQNGCNQCNCTKTQVHVERDALKDIVENVITCLEYPRGSEAQVRCLEEVGQDARAALDTDGQD